MLQCATISAICGSQFERRPARRRAISNRKAKSGQRTRRSCFALSMTASNSCTCAGALCARPQRPSQGVKNAGIQRQDGDGHDARVVPRNVQTTSLPDRGGWLGQVERGGDAQTQFTIEPRNDEPICFARLWCRTRSDEDGEVESFTMVTQPPGALSDVHDRAPVVLWQDDWARWLNLDADVDDLLSAAPADCFPARPFAAGPDNLQ